MTTQENFQYALNTAIVSKQVNTSVISSRKEAWGIYFQIMLEEPHMIKCMPDSHFVADTIKSIFPKVDWVN
jgi:hypothetical protein